MRGNKLQSDSQIKSSVVSKTTSTFEGVTSNPRNSRSIESSDLEKGDST
jgi:hypothetical protein